MNPAAAPIVLFICVSNAGKSQMAEAIARHMGSDALDARSARTSPKTSLNPLAAEVVAEAGAAMSGQGPKAIDPELLRSADRVIILGEDAQVETMPGMRSDIERWITDEPSQRGIDGIERMRLVRDEIERRVRILINELKGSQP